LDRGYITGTLVTDLKSPGANMELAELREVLQRFAAERNWDQFHSPKNLAMALSVEVAELAEHFQWLTEEQSRALSSEEKQRVAEEVADVLIYLVRLADKLGVDIGEAVTGKMEVNAQKYPADKVRGKSDKYTRYKDKPR
jgi:NTP pyrophosphatase (non-canonical NTP hydrolase)